MADTSKAKGEKFDLTVEQKKGDEEDVSRFEGEGGAPAADKGEKEAAKTPEDVSVAEAKQDPPAYSGRPAPVAAKKDDAKEPPIQRHTDERLAGVGEGDDRNAGEPFEDLPPGAANKNMDVEKTHGAARDTTGANVPFVANGDRAARDDRLRMAKDGSRIEERPLTHPGLKTKYVSDVDYSVEKELLEQWPLHETTSADRSE